MRTIARDGWFFVRKKFGLFSNEKVLTSTLLNILGAQIFRVVLARLVLWLKRFRFSLPQRDKELWKSYIQDGIIVLPNFLSSEEFEKLKENFHQRVNKSEDLERDYFSGSTRISKVIFDQDNAPSCLQSLMNHPQILGLVSKIEGRRIESLNQIYYERALFDPNDEDPQQLLHKDTYFTSSKIFYTIGEMSKKNGAFVFSKGTHRLSLQRLAFEYWSSIFSDSKNARMTEETRKKWSFVEQSIEAPPNTLVIVDVFGLHRRGWVQESSSRDVIRWGTRSNPFFSV